MFFTSRQTSAASHAHIPQHIEQAMNQHLQQSMPAHLKKYVSSDHPTYVPQHAQKEIANYMQKAMPTHLKQYAGAYVEQRIVQPNTANPGAFTPRSPRSSPPPMPDKLRLGHSMPYGEQHNVQWNERPITQPAATPAPPTTQQQPPHPSQPDYSFIMDPEKPARKPLFSGDQSVVGRLLIALVGLFALLIIFVIVRGIFSGSSNMPQFVSLAQKQQEIIHLAANASEQENLPVTTRNFVVTTQASLNSTQKETLEYIDNNGAGIDTKVLNQTVDSSLDQELEAANASSSYDQVLRAKMKELFSDYQQVLQRTFDSTDGPKGRELLDDAFQESELLLQLLK